MLNAARILGLLGVLGMGAQIVWMFVEFPVPKDFDPPIVNPVLAALIIAAAGNLIVKWRPRLGGGLMMAPAIILMIFSLGYLYVALHLIPAGLALVLPFDALFIAGVMAIAASGRPAPPLRRPPPSRLSRACTRCGVRFIPYANAWMDSGYCSRKCCEVAAKTGGL